MSSAACYTNKIRIIAEAKNTKVEYPGKIGKNWNPLYSTLPCNSNYDILDYVKVKCKKPCEPLLR